MTELTRFRERIQELMRRASPFERRATQRDLADAIGLSRVELNKRLHGASGTRLTPQNVRAIVRTLADWGSISTQAEVVELLDLVACPHFTPAEWGAPPLDALASLEQSGTVAASVHVLVPTLMSNLPTRLTSFVGRTREIQELEQLLTDTRLLTLTGTGGCGKTRLALAVAAQRIERYRHGVCWLELAGISDPAHLAHATLSALEVREQPGRPPLETLIEYLRNREMLVVFDNCEHLIEAVAQLAHELLLQCPRLTVLATSREALRIDGEVVWQVPPLRLPGALDNQDPAKLGKSESIQLFVDRACLASPHFKLTPESTEAVRRICVRLDGIPLAIELAAARVRTLPVEDISRRLEHDMLDMLAMGNRTAPQRQQTLRGLLDWSYNLLPVAEQTLFRRLSVFAGGFDVEAGEAVAGDQGQNILDLLTPLVEKSLIVYDDHSNVGRYRFLQPVREYASALLTGQELDATLQLRAEWATTIAERAEPELYGSRRLQWFDRLEQERDNFRAVLQWCTGEKGNPLMGLRLVGALWRFWEIRGYLSEGRDWVRSLLALNDDAPASLRARAMLGLGMLETTLSNFGVAQPLLTQSLTMFRDLEDSAGTARCLTCLGVLAYRRSDLDQAESYYGESLRLYRALGEKGWVAGALTNLGTVAADKGDYALARQLHSESLTLYEALGDRMGTSVPLSNLGMVSGAMGDYEAAGYFLRRSLTIRREYGEKRGLAIVLGGLGNLAYQAEDFQAARAYFQESVDLYRSIGDKRGVSLDLAELAMVLRRLGEFAGAEELYNEGLVIAHEINGRLMIIHGLEGLAELEIARQRGPDVTPKRLEALRRAATLFGAAEALREVINAQRAPSTVADYEFSVAKVQSALQSDDFSRHWSVGRSLDWNWAVRYALRQVPYQELPSEAPTLGGD